jgi:predicted metal-dependent phosphoesterase TrpH
VGIDLHIHSTASDGTLTPAQIVDLACKKQLGAIAITDHDTIDGARQLSRIDIPPSLKVLSGVELSAAPPPFASSSGSFHILGYGFNLEDDEMNRTLKRLQAARNNRNPEIVARLNRLGLPITLDEVFQEVGGGQAGRPHIARAMVRKGLVTTIDQAFDRYLAHGKPAYVDKFRISCRQAIEMIRAAGGLSVLAHPFLLGIETTADLENLVVALKDIGLEGIEVYYPEHPPRETAIYSALAERHGLLKTGGTDFHGDLIPEIQIGSGSGGFFVPYMLFEQLQERLSRHTAGQRRCLSECAPQPGPSGRGAA